MRDQTSSRLSASILTRQMRDLQARTLLLQPQLRLPSPVETPMHTTLNLPHRHSMVLQMGKEARDFGKFINLLTLNLQAKTCTTRKRTRMQHLPFILRREIPSPHGLLLKHCPQEI